MNSMVKEIASVNLFIIWIIIIGGLAFLKMVKRHLED